VKAELWVESRNAVKLSREIVAVARSSDFVLFVTDEVSSGLSLRNTSVGSWMAFGISLSEEDVA
jgi:hypothetical protein